MVTVTLHVRNPFGKGPEMAELKGCVSGGLDGEAAVEFGGEAHEGREVGFASAGGSVSSLTSLDGFLA